MPLLVRMRKQWAVYWALKGVNQYSEGIYDLPEEIRVRWEDEQTEGFPTEGKLTVFSTTVYFPSEPDGIAPMIGGMVWLDHRLKDLEKPLPPPPDAHRILMVEIIPNLRVRQWLRVAKF